MKFIVLFEDNPEADPGIRRTHMAAHLAFLEAHAANISAAGPLSKPTGEPGGGLWLVEADDAPEVDRLVHEDPFWPTGLRKSYAILKWTQVFAGGTRLIQP
jgi:uncharacterized protein